MLQNLNLPNSDIKLRAKYKLLLNDYYTGNFEKLRADLDTLLSTSPLNKNLSNDLITLSLFLDENLVGDHKLVRSYAESEFMVRQHKIARALNRLSVLYPAASGHPVVDDILALMAKLQLDTGQPEGAVLTLRSLINDYPFSPLPEKAHLNIARLYAEQLNKPELAAAEYEQFLRNYSRSIYLDEAREKLRKLRKNRN